MGKIKYLQVNARLKSLELISCLPREETDSAT